jgi:catechol 2,3-dioxygenase-like lactoylglutathione lyase family enzyme
MTETTAAPAVTGFHHFSPTVSDVEASAQWYERVFGMNRVPVPFPHYGAEEGGYAVLLIDPPFRHCDRPAPPRSQPRPALPREPDRPGPHLIRRR